MADTRQRILDTARRLTHQRGYAAVSIGDIAAEVGIAKGNLVYHFPNRLALLKAVAQDRAHILSGLIAQWQERHSDPLDRLLQLIDFFESEAGFLAENGCPQGTMTAELGKSVPDLREDAISGLELLIEFSSTAFGTKFPPAEATAKAEELVAALQGTILLGYGRGSAALIQRLALRLRQRLIKEWAEAETGADDV